MVYRTGTYRVSDFIRIGVCPLPLVVGALTIGLVSVIWPFERAGQVWGVPGGALLDDHRVAQFPGDLFFEGSLIMEDDGGGAAF